MPEPLIHLGTEALELQSQTRCLGQGVWVCPILSWHHQQLAGSQQMYFACSVMLVTCSRVAGFAVVRDVCWGRAGKRFRWLLTCQDLCKRRLSPSSAEGCLTVVRSEEEFAAISRVSHLQPQLCPHKGRKQYLQITLVCIRTVSTSAFLPPPSNSKGHHRTDSSDRA